MGELIYCQRDIPKNKWRYGFRSSAVTGCGWIAVHNALCLMGYQPKPEKLIKTMERQLPFIHGNFGTNLFGPALYLKRRGFSVKCYFARSKFDQKAEEADVCILYYWWREKWKFGAHFVALHHTENGFVGYNTYRNSKGADFYGESLEEFLKQRKYFATVLFGIKKRILLSR